MQGKGNRVFKEGCAHHLYLKARKGNVLFYRTEDYVYFLTLLSILAQRYGIVIEALCIMFNHIHLFIQPVDRAKFNAFCRDLQSMFSTGYNNEYHLEGRLMMRSGYAPKITGKSILSCLIYIDNNPVAGHLTGSAIEYKWNLLPFFRSDHPFSEKLVKRSSRLKMREAAKTVDYCFKKGQPMNYTVLRNIFRDMTPKEKLTVTDYIVNLYNPIDKESFLKRFGNWETAMLAIDSTTGAERDFHEAWEDYSVYLIMLKRCLHFGILPTHFNTMKNEELRRLASILSGIPESTAGHVRRFLHLASNVSI